MFAVSSHSPRSKLCAAKLLDTITSSDQAGTKEILRANIVNATGEATAQFKSWNLLNTPLLLTSVLVSASWLVIADVPWPNAVLLQEVGSQSSEMYIFWWDEVGFVFKIVVSNLGLPWTVVTEVTSLISEAIPCIISVAVVAGVGATSSK